MTDERRIDRMMGCSRLGKAMLGVVSLVALSLFCSSALQRCSMLESPLNNSWLRSKDALKELEIAIEAFHLEYNHWPITTSASEAKDTTVRSRSQILNELSPFPGAKYNSKEIKFVVLPPANKRKYGLWQNGEEWVLSDLWSEPYYVILDTNGDGKITNPEFGADQSDPNYAEKCRLNPPLATIQSSVLIYSSGKDRDPKTWHDNICSWRDFPFPTQH